MGQFPTCHSLWTLDWPLTDSLYLHTVINLFEPIYSLYAALFHIIIYYIPCKCSNYTHHKLGLSLDSLMDDVMELSMGDDASTGNWILTVLEYHD